MDTTDMQTDAPRHTAARAVTMDDTHADGPAIAAIDPALRKAKRTKIKDGRSRLLLLLACLAYIVTVFTAISMGLQEISHYLEPRLKDALVELRAQRDVRYRENMLFTQLESLTESRLGHEFGETYEDCLARGLQTANQKFFGLGFQYPNIRNQSMLWTTDNCMRLLYVPQRPNTSPHQAILARWASTTYHARRVLEMTADVLVSGWNRVVALWNRPAKFVANRAPATDPSLPRERVMSPARSRTRMPFPFGLDCRGTGLCRLTYPQTFAVADKASVLPDELAKNYIRIEALSRFYTKVNLFQSFMASLAVLFTSLMALPFVTYVVAGIYLAKGMPYPQTEDNKTQRPTKKDGDRFTPEERYTAKSILAQFCAMLTHTIFQRGSCPSDKLTLMIAVGMFLAGISMSVNFFVPISPQLESFPRMREALNDLYLMIAAELKQPAVAPPQTNEAAGTPAAVEEVTIEQSEEETVPAESSMSRTSTPAQSLPVSLASTVQDDLRDELDTMRQERSYEATVETESESDFDGEQYVDLTGRVTLTTTEEDSDDAVIVDA